MKKHIIAFLSISLLLLTVLLPFAVAAAAGTLAWSSESVPGTAGNMLGPAGIDVRDIAVASSGQIIYAVPGDSVSDNVVYKSTDTGVSWASLKVAIDSDMVAVAPDNASMAAIARGDAPAVYVTSDGGFSWDSLGIPQEDDNGAAVAIYDVAISLSVGGIYYIAAAGREADNIANVWYFEFGSPEPGWRETRRFIGFSGVDVVRSVAFSPNFSSDRALLAVSQNGNASIDFNILNLSSSAWNTRAGFPGYPVHLTSGSRIAELASASIALHPQYLASGNATGTAFVGLTISGGDAAGLASGIYRLENTDVIALKTGVNIHNIAFNGAGIVAGVYDDNAVYRSADPLAAEPVVSPISHLKGPGGENRVVVAWAGTDVVAGTSGDESAFAISRNNGRTFNDISLIDTTITDLRDVAVTADGEGVYLASDDGADLSLWRRASSWERVLSVRGTTDWLVRVTPDSPYGIYVAKKGVKNIYYNEASGNVEWSISTCAVDVQDLAAVSGEIVYVLSNDGKVSKSTDAGNTWLDAVPTLLSSGHALVSVDDNTLLAGSQDGCVAYSTDGNSSWTRLKMIQNYAGKVQVAADSNFASNGIIYAASDKPKQNVLKWTIGSSNYWTDIFRAAFLGGVYGLVTDEGMLYALEFNPDSGQSTLWRCLAPTEVTAISTDWRIMATTTGTDATDKEVHLESLPRALKMSSGGKLWAIKTNGVNRLYSFNDVLKEITVNEPKSSAVIPVNPITGIAGDIAFIWSRSSSFGATGYQLSIASDKDFKVIISTIDISSDQPVVVVLTGPEQAGAARIAFSSGATYYCRVKVTNPLYGLYSATRSFTVGSVGTLIPALLVPANGGTGISQTPFFSWDPVPGTTQYNIVLADNFALDSPIIDVLVEGGGFVVEEGLEYGETYFWAVKPVAPVMGRWSAVANFTVKENPGERAAPIVIQQSPPPVLQLPEEPLKPLQLPQIVIPSLAVDTPVTPGYVWAIIVIGAILAGGVIFLVIRYFRWAEVQEVRAVQFIQEKKSLSFAVESLFWMMTSEEDDEAWGILSADEEQELGQKVVGRIKRLAANKLLYRDFPREAVLFLNLWSHYGSCEETNAYLTGSFKADRKNVLEFLRCYLPVSRDVAQDFVCKSDFGRDEFDSVVKVVDADGVYEALQKLYGQDMDMELGREADTTDKALATQFVLIHQQVKREKGNKQA
ncbi:WD40/YVTN/BNR-like repeat-containing protein [Chloroflexota bacterium]